MWNKYRDCSIEVPGRSTLTPSCQVGFYSSRGPFRLSPVPQIVLPLPRPAPAFPRAGKWATKVLPGSKGRPRQDGGPLGAQLLGRRLGAPIRPQRVPGGDGEAASRARAREAGAGPEARGQPDAVLCGAAGSRRARALLTALALGSLRWTSHKMAL